MTVELHNRTRILEDILNNRAELTVISLLSTVNHRQHDRQEAIRIIRSETGFKVLPGTRDASVTEEIERLITQLEAEIDRLPVSMYERLLTALQALSRLLLSAQISPVVADACLRMISPIYGWALSKHKNLREIHQARLSLYSFLFAEPESYISSLFVRHYFYKYSFYARRISYLANSGLVYKADAEFDWEQCDSYVSCARLQAESRVLMTIHMGDFMGAFRYIAAQITSDRPVMSLRRDIDQLDPRHLRQADDPMHRLYIHGQDSPVDIVRALRAGNQTLAVLFDLGRDFGETTEVEFFSQPARFVRGPAQLAIAGRARIFPFVCFRAGKRNVIFMHPPFLPQARPHETLQQAAARVTQDLVRLAERWIRQSPAQWKYFDMLPAYFSHGEQRS